MDGPTGGTADGRPEDEERLRSEELEDLCAQYWRACVLGPPTLLHAAEMDRVLERFAG